MWAFRIPGGTALLACVLHLALEVSEFVLELADR